MTDLAGVSEGFGVSKGEKFDTIMVNVTRSRLRETVFALARQVRVPGFLVVEVPTHQDIEEKLRTKPSEPFHKDVYYLDGIECSVFERIVTENEEFFLDDGQLQFGFGSHSGVDEVMVGRYKLVTVLADQSAKFVKALQGLGYEQRGDRLRTVFDTFTRETPGSTEIIKVEGKTIYEMVKDLTRSGLRFAERRPS